MRLETKIDPRDNELRQVVIEFHTPVLRAISKNINAVSTFIQNPCPEILSLAWDLFSRTRDKFFFDWRDRKKIVALIF